VFGFTKKKEKPSSLMDEYIRLVYGSPPPPQRRANLQQAIECASKDLLAHAVPVAEVTEVATSLYSGPIPYSTHDLAVAAATSLFMKSDGNRRAKLAEIQLLSRMAVLDWITERKVAPLVAKAFEDTLYKMYKV
jgi:hypothetical protein